LGSGGLDLVRMFPFFGATELEVLAVLSSFCLLSTHFITAFSVKERVLVSSK
jgi:solute carrier family 45 protein 1/2/4